MWRAEDSAVGVTAEPGGGYETKVTTSEGKVVSEEEFLDTVPKEIRDDYGALLDYYTIGELEDFRAENGDKVIPMMAETELGYSYSKDRIKDNVKVRGGKR